MNYCQINKEASNICSSESFWKSKLRRLGIDTELMYLIDGLNSAIRYQTLRYIIDIPNYRYLPDPQDSDRISRAISQGQFRWVREMCQSTDLGNLVSIWDFGQELNLLDSISKIGICFRMTFHALFKEALTLGSSTLIHKYTELAEIHLEIHIEKKFSDHYEIHLERDDVVDTYRGQFRTDKYNRIFYYPEENLLEVMPDNLCNKIPTPKELASLLTQFFPVIPCVRLIGTQECILEKNACTKCTKPAIDQSCALCQAQNEFKIKPLRDLGKCKGCAWHDAFYKGFCYKCLTEN